MTKPSSSKKVAVCFVCLGNICRSPTAEGVFAQQLQVAGLVNRVVFDSAGTAAYHAGEKADRRSRDFAKKRGYELRSVARQFVAEDFDRFDYVLAMDSDNLASLERLKVERDDSGRPKSNGRAHLSLFRDFDASAPTRSSIPDPYYGGDRGFEEVLDQCERACSGLIERLRTHELVG